MHGGSGVPLPAENVYGHLKRVDWIRGHLRPGDRIVEIGCGTGYRVTLPLLVEGRDVTGCDLDTASIEAGRAFFGSFGLPDDVLHAVDVSELEGEFDVAILSEVLEHLDDVQTRQLLAAIAVKLNVGGRLLITVPNGFGWYEGESFLWKRLKLGAVFERTKLASAVVRLKSSLVSVPTEDPIPSSLSQSPHVQRYTLRSIQAALARNGFRAVETTGSVLICGQFTNVFLTGFRPAMAANAWLGSKLPALAAGFYVAAVRAS